MRRLETVEMDKTKEQNGNRKEQKERGRKRRKKMKEKSVTVDSCRGFFSFHSISSTLLGSVWTHAHALAHTHTCTQSQWFPGLIAVVDFCSTC